MFPQILSEFRTCIHRRHYVLTLHAEEEMDSDELTIYDIENTVLSGSIVERQKDSLSKEWKYRIRGETMHGESAEIIAKAGAFGKMIIITGMAPR